MSNSVIYQFVNYALEHIKLVKSTGFYDGQAGISLCLFEVSQYLNDTYIEDMAFNLLQEALVDSKEDISFEKGLSGIGYVLTYLIRNQFIETNIDEIFGAQLNRIIVDIDKMKEGHSRKEAFHSIRTVYFLNELNIIDPDKKVTKYINFLLEESTLFLEEEFSIMKDQLGICSKMNLLDNFKVYLKIVDECRYIVPSLNVLNLYSELYQRSEFVSDYMIGYHLNNVASALKDPYLKSVAIQNKIMALRNIHLSTMSLSQQIDLLNILLLDKDGERSPLVILLEENLAQEEGELFNWSILHKIPRTDCLLGYQSGVSRLLLYWIYKASSNLNSQLFL